MVALQLLWLWQNEAVTYEWIKREFLWLPQSININLMSVPWPAHLNTLRESDDTLVVPKM